MSSNCKACSRGYYPTTLCDGCGKSHEECKCSPIPTITISYDLFVDNAWGAEEGETIGGMPQLGFAAASVGGEGGEVWEKVKKYYRDDGGTAMTPERKDAILKELGDVAYYLTKTAHLLGYSLNQVLESNVFKLSGRVERGTMHGDGDDR